MPAFSRLIDPDLVAILVLQKFELEKTKRKTVKTPSRFASTAAALDKRRNSDFSPWEEEQSDMNPRCYYISL
jgi:hypothetical protein